MFGDIIQPTHLLFILLVALIVLGPKRLPEVGRSLGKGLRDFRGAMNGVQQEAHDMLSLDPDPVADDTADTTVDMTATEAELPVLPPFDPDGAPTVAPAAAARVPSGSTFASDMAAARDSGPGADLD